MKEYLSGFFQLCDYPDDAASSLLADYGRLMDCPETKAVFDDYIGQYERSADGRIRFDKMLDDVREAVASSGVHTYSAELLIHCCLSRHLRKLYRERGIADEIWLNSMLDLRHKLYECRSVHGIWGSFVAGWFDGFFSLDRFAIGRLQYEHSLLSVCPSYTSCGVDLTKDATPVLHIHIPSGSRLTAESVSDSFSAAYRFFSGTEYMQGDILPLQCSSWLLYPKMDEFLAPDSNVMKFRRCFDIVGSCEDKNFGDCWRLFDMYWTGNAADLPRDTDMRRRYADWLALGNTAGEGCGVILYDGREIINKR